MAKWTRLVTVVLAFFQAGLFAKYAVQLNAGNSRNHRSRAHGSPTLWNSLALLPDRHGHDDCRNHASDVDWRADHRKRDRQRNQPDHRNRYSCLSSQHHRLDHSTAESGFARSRTAHIFFPRCSLRSFCLDHVGTILVIQGQRRIPLQYAQTHCRDGMKSRRQFPHSSKSQLCRSNPCDFCLLASDVPCDHWPISRTRQHGSDNSPVISLPAHGFYMFLYVLLIIFFTYFWTATQFKPEQIASDMKKNGAFIPGIRQGKPTQDYLEVDHEPHHFGWSRLPGHHRDFADLGRQD